MGTLENKKLELKDEKGKATTYKDLITLCLDNAPDGGFTRADLKERDRIEEAMNSSKNGTLTFEDADLTALKKIVGQMKWGVRNKEISGFVEDIDNVKTK